MSDELKTILNFMSSSDIYDLSLTSKENNYLISKILKEDTFFSFRLDHHYSQATGYINYLTHSDPLINIDRLRFKSLYCRSLDIFVLMKDKILPECFWNYLIDKGDAYYSINTIINVSNSKSYNELILLMYMYQVSYKKNIHY